MQSATRERRKEGKNDFFLSVDPENNILTIQRGTLGQLASRAVLINNK